MVPHPDGSYWFTDPPYGGQLYEGTPDAAGGKSNRQASSTTGSVSRPRSATAKRELPTQSIAWTPAGASIWLWPRTRCPTPTACASRPITRSCTSPAPARARGTGPGGKGEMYVFDVGSDNKLSNQKLFTDFMVDGVKCGPDGVRADVNGNLWCSSNAGRAVGYSGVTVWTPEGKLIGRIRLPEMCGNVCFGGPKRNRLFMAASQSLYAVYTQHPGCSARLNRALTPMGATSSSAAGPEMSGWSWAREISERSR